MLTCACKHSRSSVLWTDNSGTQLNPVEPTILFRGRFIHSICSSMYFREQAMFSLEICILLYASLVIKGLRVCNLERLHFTIRLWKHHQQCKYTFAPMHSHTHTTMNAYTHVRAHTHTYTRMHAHAQRG